MIKRLAFLIAVLLPAGAPLLTAQSARQYYRAGEEFFEKREYENAIKQFSRALAMDPDHERAYVLRAHAHARLGDYAHAASDYDRAIGYNGKDAELYYLSGNAHFREDRYTVALTKLDRAIELKWNYLEAYQVRSLVYLKLERYQEALEDIRKYLGMQEDEKGYYYLAQVYEKLRMYDEAEKAYRRSIEMNRQIAGTHFALAGLLFKGEKYSQANEAVTEMLRWDPGNLEGMLLQSRIHAAGGNYPKAIEVLSLASIEYPDESRIYLARGNHYALMHQEAFSIIDYTKVIALDPRLAEAYYRRAEAYEAIGDDEKARKDYEKLLDMSADEDAAGQMREEVSRRIFELKREDNRPEVTLLEPSSGSGQSVDIPLGAEVVAVMGLIQDESELKSLQVNNFTVPVEKTEDGYRFLTSVNVREAEQIIVQVADIYDNAETAIFSLRRTEVDPPTAQIIAPYGSENNILYLDTGEPVIYIEGRVEDESRIRNIYIDSVSASYIPSDFNPAFSAMVRVEDKEEITVMAEDEYGNRSETVFTLNRDARFHANNPMGKTWAVFIGNANYESFATLEGPGRDINMMKAALAGYKIHNIIHRQDMTKQEMERFFAIELRDLIRSNRVNSMLIWYAGHGKYINQTGYWIPVDAAMDDEFSYFNINALKASMQSYPDFLTHTLVITDACESGPTFFQAMRGELKERDCSDWEATRFRSSQVFSSAGYELAVDDSQFTRTFARVLTGNPNQCVSIEHVVRMVTSAVVNNRQQTPQFGKIAGMEDENGTFFFIPREN